MGIIEAIVGPVIGLVFVLFMPVLVWATVIAGLYQIIQEKIRGKRSRPKQYSPFT